MNYVYAKMYERRSALGQKRWRFTLYAKNHEPLARSTQPYRSLAAAEHAIELLFGVYERRNVNGVLTYKAARVDL